MSDFNPIQYTSRTAESILQDINNSSQLVDKPDWFKFLIAGLGDVISMWNNAIANNLLLRTAFTRKNVQLILELIDYFMSSQETASGPLLFYLDGSTSFPLTVSQNNLVALTAGSTAVSAKRFEARGGVTVTDVNEGVLFSNVIIATDIFTVTRDYTTGEKVRLTTTGALPSPLALSTDYYVIRVSSTEIRLATSLENALANTYIIITTQGTGTHTIRLYSFSATCYQQQTKEASIVGTSNGVLKWQTYDLPDIDILKDTLEITINSVVWTRVSSFIDSTSTDKHYRLYYNTDNSAQIEFGNGVYGMIPPAFDIYSAHAVGGGSDSNVTELNKVNIYGGADTNVVSVANVEALTGGDDPQTIEEAKILGPLLLKARDRYITTEDGNALVLAYGGVSLVATIKNAFGVLSSRILCIANGGGLLDSATKTAIQDYLIDRTVLESIDVRVEDPTITPVAVTSAGKVLSGYVWSGQVENNFRMGWKLFWSEAGAEIKADYISNGVDSARALINTIFSESFTSADNAQIKAFLDNLNPRAIGEADIQDSDAKGFMDSNTIGLDYLTISIPSFPYSVAEDEITTYGTLTLTEII
jgi:hypothetical protein